MPFTAKSNDPDEILNLMELVVGAAVMCEAKAVFIRNIFQLNHVSQAVLKDMIEQVLSRAEDIDTGTGEGGEATGTGGQKKEQVGSGSSSSSTGGGVDNRSGDSVAGAGGNANVDGQEHLRSVSLDCW